MDNHFWSEAEGCSFEGSEQGNLQTPVGIISLYAWNMIRAHVPMGYQHELCWGKSDIQPGGGQGGSHKLGR